MASTNKILKDILSAKGGTPSDEDVSNNDLVRAIAIAEGRTLPAKAVSTHDLLVGFVVPVDDDEPDKPTD